MTLQADTTQAARLGTEDEAIAAAQRFAASVAPGASERDRDGSLPAAELEQLARSGLLAITVPSAHGGLEASTRTLVEVIRTLAVADPAIAQLALPHFVISRFLSETGSEAQRRRFFAYALAGQRFGNATAERDTRTVLEKNARLTALTDGELRVDARKSYATGSLGADWIGVLAIDDAEQPVSVLVPRDAAGLEVLEDWTSIGQRATVSGTVIVDGVITSADEVLPINRLFARVNLFEPFDQIAHAAIDVGIARAALIDAADFVRTRARPWPEAEVERASDEPHLVLRFGQLTTRLHAAEALLRRGAEAVDRAEATDPLTPAAVARAAAAVDEAKAFGGEVSVELASALFEVSGSSATDARRGLDRHWRNARVHTLHDPARWRYHHVGRRTLDAASPDEL